MTMKALWRIFPKPVVGIWPICFLLFFCAQATAGVVAGRPVGTVLLGSCAFGFDGIALSLLPALLVPRRGTGVRRITMRRWLLAAFAYASIFGLTAWSTDKGLVSSLLFSLAGVSVAAAHGRQTAN
jgi:hypothetical protein